jgi:hypothetical protein
MEAAQTRALPWDDEMERMWEAPEPADAAPPARVMETERPRPRAARGKRAAGNGLAAWGLWLALGAALCATLLVTVTTAADWARVQLDDLRYGRPRTTHLTAFVGHNDGDGLPTQLIAVNLNRRITVIELPGSDPARIRTLAGPYLVGKDEDLTVATMRLLDVNGDSHPDLLLRVKSEELVYVNDQGEFRLMTRAERPAIERTLGGGQ